jgi:hypothetical protein
VTSEGSIPNQPQISFGFVRLETCSVLFNRSHNFSSQRRISGGLRIKRAQYVALRPHEKPSSSTEGVGRNLGWRRKKENRGADWIRASESRNYLVLIESRRRPDRPDAVCVPDAKGKDSIWELFPLRRRANERFLTTHSALTMTSDESSFDANTKRLLVT